MNRNWRPQAPNPLSSVRHATRMFLLRYPRKAQTRVDWHSLLDFCAEVISCALGGFPL